MINKEEILTRDQCFDILLGENNSIDHIFTRKNKAIEKYNRLENKFFLELYFEMIKIEYNRLNNFSRLNFYCPSPWNDKWEWDDKYVSHLKSFNDLDIFDVFIFDINKSYTYIKINKTSYIDKDDPEFIINRLDLDEKCINKLGKMQFIK